MNEDQALNARYSPLFLISTVVGVVAGLAVTIHLTIPDTERVHELAGLAIETGLLAAGTAVALWLAVIKPLRGVARAERAATKEREAQLLQHGARQEFETKLHRALEMASDEQAAYRSVSRTLRMGTPRLSVELLLADSSEAHLKQAVASGPDGNGPGCQVVSPHDCPAVRRAQTLLFDSSEAIDACPYLEGREQGVVAAVCVPVSVGGRSIGVVHSTTSVENAAQPDEVARLETLASHSGARLGMLRVMQQTHLQAATDPLTGLLNRRAFENQAQELMRRGTPFAVAMGDLDHFKILNDTFGHEAGDRALRLFARVVRESVRADDIVSRFGGEEFILAFPGRSSAEAAMVLGRLQQHLRETLASGTVPVFTASFGVADSYDASSLEDLFRIADTALFRAKREGRDRIIVDSIDAPQAADEPGLGAVAA